MDVSSFTKESKLYWNVNVEDKKTRNHLIGMDCKNVPKTKQLINAGKDNIPEACTFHQLDVFKVNKSELLQGQTLPAKHRHIGQEKFNHFLHKNTGFEMGR